MLECLRLIIPDLPMIAQHGKPSHTGCPKGKETDPVMACCAWPGRRNRGGHGNLKMGVGVRPQLQTGFAQRKPVGLHRHGFISGEQRNDRTQRFFHTLALGRGINAHHVGIGRQSTWPNAEHDPTPGEVIEEHHTVSQNQRLMIRQGAHAGSQTNVARTLGGCGDEDLGRGDDLQASGVMFADPCLVVAEFVKANEQF